MTSTFKKVIGVSAIGVVSALELLNLQQAQAAPVNFTGSSVTYPLGGTVQVSITVDGASGVYRITNITTPVQPTTGANASYAAFAIPTLTSAAMTAQSANINSVSGASQISGAWISSLSSAISAAAAAGEKIGQTVSGTTPTPTPTPTVTPTPTPTPKVTPVPTRSKHHSYFGRHEDDHERVSTSHNRVNLAPSRGRESQNDD